MDGATLNPALVEQVERLLGGEDGFIDGLLRSLENAYPALKADAPAAIGHAVEKIIVRPEEPRDVRKYLSAVAFNELKRVGRHRSRHGSLEVLHSATDFEPEDVGWSVLERALIDETYRELRAQVETWETGSVRTVTLLYLEAVHTGSPLPSDAAAEIASELLGREVDADFVRTWKSRGFKRLQTYVNSMIESETGGTPDA